MYVKPDGEIFNEIEYQILDHLNTVFKKISFTYSSESFLRFK